MTKREGFALFEAARHIEGPNGRGTIVEIGSFYGRSTLCLAFGSRAGSAPRIHAIDPHIGSPKHEDRLGCRDTWPKLLDTLARHSLGDLVVPIRKPSVDATSDVLGEIDFLFIDGSHDYDDVAADFATWFPRVRPGGLIAFHDSWHMSGVRRASGEILRVSRDIAEPSLVDTITFLRKVDGNGRKDRIQNRMFVVKRNVFGLPGFLRLTYRGTRLQRDT
ncbi:MAG: class I SAM-dependent methyltransferase [Planctomycetes bacterium]|nr:class I SAM-dependent methyltransferase [Planctomycetota bacterium]